jgi:hypothetical protein
MGLLDNYNKPTPAKLGLAIKGICMAIITGSIIFGASEQTMKAYHDFVGNHPWLIISIGLLGATADEIGKMLTKD